MFVILQESVLQFKSFVSNFEDHSIINIQTDECVSADPINEIVDEFKNQESLKCVL